MDPVTSPLIHKDSGRRAHVDPGEKNPALPSVRHSIVTSSKARGEARRLVVQCLQKRMASDSFSAD